MNTTDNFGPDTAPSNAPQAVPPAFPVPCRSCRNPIGARDAFCKYCGTRQRPADAFYYHPVWILLLALTVLGPIALGLVWKSPSMGAGMKFVLAAVIIVYSAVSLYAIFYVGMLEYRELKSLMDVLQ